MPVNLNGTDCKRGKVLSRNFALCTISQVCPEYWVFLQLLFYQAHLSGFLENHLSIYFFYCLSDQSVGFSKLQVTKSVFYGITFCMQKESNGCYGDL